MARSLWSGSISFGLVSIPVRLFTAEREHEVHFHQLNDRTGHRIRYEKVDAGTGKEVSNDHIVRGIEVGKGSWVTVDDDEIEAIRPRSTKTVDVEDFVDLTEIDPIFFDRTYYMAPDDNPGAVRAYAILLEAMTRTQRAGIGKVVIRDKQYLAAIRPFRDVLVMSTMRFADEVVDVDDIDDLHIEIPDVEGKARKMAQSLIESLASPFDPTKYHDTYTEELQDLIDRKARGETIEVEEQPQAAPQVIDLMAALQASVDAARDRRGPGRASSGGSGATSGSARRDAKRHATKRAKQQVERAATPGRKAGGRRRPASPPTKRAGKKGGASKRTGRAG